MTRPNWQLYASALVLGFLLVAVRLVVSFFPLFNIAEILLFGGAAAALAYVFRVGPSWWCVLLLLPTLLLVAHMVVFWLGADSLRRGIGVGHALSLALIPLSTFAGAYYGLRLTRRLSPAL